MPDYLVVGAGFSGAILAERIAAGLNSSVLLIDRRNHLAGNAHDFFDDAGILVHKYGPHIFHTNSSHVFKYLSRFTAWRPYRHRVLACVDGQLVPFPINRETIRLLCGISGEPHEIEEWLRSVAEKPQAIRNAEDVVVSRFGRYLYDKLFYSYTRKQWGREPVELAPAVTARVSPRLSNDDGYFQDNWQMMPAEGYTRMFENIVDHKNIVLSLKTKYEDVKHLPFRHTFFTGPIDEFFDYRFGNLPYRSLRFVHKTIDCDRFQPAAVITYPNDHDYTRITEFRHLTGQQHAKTSIAYEYPEASGDPFYPIPAAASSALYERYRELALEHPKVTFSGRLGSYRYFNMDQAAAQSLTIYRALRARTVAG